MTEEKKDTADVSASVPDILIVGAGFAGLAAADAINQWNQAAKMKDPNAPSISFAVLEASDRAGGRTKTVTQQDVNGQAKEVGFVDVGGQYLGATQTYMAALVERFGIATFDTFLPADKISIFQPREGDDFTLYTGDYPLTSNVVDFISVIESLILMVKTHLADPWNLPDAESLDKTTVEAWALMQACLKGDPYAQELLKLAIRCAFSVEWDQISLLYLLFYGASAGSFRAFENVTRGGDTIRFTYGTASLVDALVGSLPPGSIHFDRVVKAIENGQDGVKLMATHGPENEVWSPKRVIVAMSPRVSINTIQYTPDISKDRRKLAEGMVMGRTIKGFLFYDKPWWRQRFSGYVLSAKGPACWIMDNTWQDPYSGQYQFPSLMTFIAGATVDDARYATKEKRRVALEEQVKALFGSGQAAVAYVEEDWQTSLSAGCPAAVPGLGAIVDFKDAIRKPEENLPVHWAGSEAGLEWVGGYMNGAVQSGMRAASDAIAALLKGAD